MPADLHASMSSVPAGAVSCLPSTVNLTSAMLVSCSDQRLHGNDGCPGLVPGDVVFKFFAELLHEAECRHCGSIAQRAERSAHHVFRQVLDVIDIFLRTAAVVHAGQGLLDPVRALAAWNAPAARL